MYLVLVVWLPVDFRYPGLGRADGSSIRYLGRRREVSRDHGVHTGGHALDIGGLVTNRATKERKLMVLMISDLELDLDQPEMIEVGEAVHALADEELDRTLANRLDLSYPVDEQAMEQALSRIEEPE